MRGGPDDRATAEAMREKACLRQRTREAQHARVLKLASGGDTATEIARAMGIHRNTVVKILASAGIQPTRRDYLLPIGSPA